MSKFTADMVRKYFETRLPGRRLPAAGNGNIHCPFHDDQHTSLSLNIDKGVWSCKGCGNQGGILEFEKLLSKVAPGAAWVNISEILGQKVSGNNRPESVWVYTDEEGYWLFRKIRYARTADGKKPIFQERYTDRGTWEKGTAGVRQVLYNLPAVLTSNVVMVVEGEKCADLLNGLDLYPSNPGLRCIATTAPGGSTGWRSEFGKYFTGKAVFVFTDNDAPGRKYAEHAARNAHECGAKLVKVVTLPGLGDGEDVYDYMQNHTNADLAAEIKKAPKYSQALDDKVGLQMFVDVERFVKTLPEQIDWLVAGTRDYPFRGLIQRGTGGFILATPKTGKSLIALDLCLSLSLGTDTWLDTYELPRRAKVAIVSREDYSGITGDRITQLMRTKSVHHNVLGDMKDYLYINTRQQTESFLLDRDDDLEMLISDLSKFKCDFLLMDVFRRLHMVEENSNDEMQVLLERISRIQSEVGCAIAVIHHVSKTLDIEDLPQIFRFARGASAIHGWMEFGIGVGVVNPEAAKRDWIRKMVFENKAGGGPDPIWWKVEECQMKDPTLKPDWIRLSPTMKPERGKSKIPESSATWATQRLAA